MRLKRFLAKKVYGFRSYDIKFNKDVTFLTGINGSGKTTVLNAITALISPSLSSLSNLEFGSLLLEFDQDEEVCFIQASKKDGVITVESSKIENKFSYQEYPFGQTPVGSKDKDFEQEYFRELMSNSAQNPLLKYIASLPTPMLLGLDRKNRFIDDGMNTSSIYKRFNNRQNRNTGSTLLDNGITDAETLAENAYREVLIRTSRVNDELRRNLLLQLLTVEPSPMTSSLSVPTREDMNEISNIRRDIEKLPIILDLPKKDVMDRIVPFLENLRASIEKIPSNLKITDVFSVDPNEDLTNFEKNRNLMNEVMNWSRNSSQLKRIRPIVESIAKYNDQIKILGKPVDQYLKLVNAFLEDGGKKLGFDEAGNIVFHVANLQKSQSIRLMSSGEAQIVVILTHLSFNQSAQNASVFIIDEPELSLHVQWQELFVDSVLKANPNIQYIMATHSPSIILDRTKKCVDISDIKRIA